MDDGILAGNYGMKKIAALTLPILITIFCGLVGLMACQKDVGVSSFWIDENDKYDGNRESIHSALISITKIENHLEVDLFLRGFVQNNGNRIIFKKDHLLVNSGSADYKIIWIDPNSLEIEIKDKDRSILKKEYHLSKN